MRRGKWSERALGAILVVFAIVSSSCADTAVDGSRLDLAEGVDDDLGVAEAALGEAGSVTDPSVFNWRFYAFANPDLPWLTTPEAAEHDWKTWGLSECRRAHPTFHVAQYLQRYADLRNAFGTCEPALQHYLNFGRNERRIGVLPSTPSFARPGAWYTQADFDAANAKASAAPWRGARQDLAAYLPTVLAAQLHPVVNYQSHEVERLVEDAGNAHLAAFNTKVRVGTSAQNAASRGKAIEILSAWANTNLSIDAEEQAWVDWALSGWMFMTAADIVKSGGISDWPAYSQFETWAHHVVFGALHGEAHGVDPYQSGIDTSNRTLWALYGLLTFAHVFDNRMLFDFVASEIRSHLMSQEAFWVNDATTLTCSDADGEWFFPGPAHGSLPREICRGNRGRRGDKSIYYSGLALEAMLRPCGILGNVSGVNPCATGATSNYIRRAFEHYSHYAAQHPDEWPYSSQYPREHISQYRNFGALEEAAALYGSPDIANSAAIYRPQSSADETLIMLKSDASNALLLDSFQDGVADGWSPESGAWAAQAQPDSGNFWYIQPEQFKQGARATAGSTSWSQYEVSLRLRSSWMGSDGRIGILARYQDYNNWYGFFIERASGVVRIVRSVNGVETTLRTESMSFLLDRWYDVRVSVSLSSLRLFVNDQLKAHAWDSTFTTGKMGVYTHRSVGMFDQVEVTPARLGVQAFDSAQHPFTLESGSWSIFQAPDTRLLRQQGVNTVLARASTGNNTWQNYTVSAKLKIYQLGTQGAGAGLYARYRDLNNYYNFHFYRTQGGTQSIRIEKRVNGVSSVLAELPTSIPLNTYVWVRAEVRGPRLRMYVYNSETALGQATMLEATDYSFYSGRVALDAHRSDVGFDLVQVD